MIGIDRTMTMVFKIGYLPDEKDFMLQLSDFAFEALDDTLINEVI